MSDKINVRVELLDKNNACGPRLVKVLELHKPSQGEYLVHEGDLIKMENVFHLINQADAEIAVSCLVQHEVYERYATYESWRKK
jgi:hypothetical protein